jgi:hypothetical protein
VDARRPVSVSAAALLLGFLGLFDLLGGLLIGTGGLLFGAVFAGALGTIGQAAVLVGAGLALLGVAAVVTAVALGRLRPWAWSTALALALLGAVFPLLRVGGEDVLAPLFTAALHAAVVLLLLLPDSRRALGRG